MTTRSIQVAASANDFGIKWDGTQWVGNALNLNSLVAGYASATSLKHGTGMRFLGVYIPKSATIVTAYITFTGRAGALTGANCNTYITGELVDGGVFSNLADYQARRGTACGGADDTKRTVAQVAWNNVASQALDVAQNSPEIKTVIQEQVTGAAQVNLVLFWDDHDDRSTHASQNYRDFYSYDGSATKCPLLYVEFTPVYKVWPSIALKAEALGIV